MGMWLKPDYVRLHTSMEALKALPDDQLEIKISIAERRLNEAFALDVMTLQQFKWANARDVPMYWYGLFLAWPEKEQEFYADARAACVLLMDRRELNPRELISQSVKGASAEFGPDIPADAAALMARWVPPGQQNQILR